jgi:hypothetical protein
MSSQMPKTPPSRPLTPHPSSGVPQAPPPPTQQQLDQIQWTPPKGLLEYEAVNDWVSGLQQQVGTGSDAPKLLGELLKDGKSVEILVPHLYRLCSGGQGPKIRSSTTQTGASFDAAANCITVANTKEVKGGGTISIPPYHQLWNFLFETCNALHRSEFRELDKRTFPQTRTALVKWGNDKCAVEAKSCEEFGDLAGKLWEHIRHKGASLDDSTSKHLAIHQTIHQKGLDWKAHFNIAPHEPNKCSSYPESMLSPDFYIYDKLCKAQPSQLEKLIGDLVGTKVGKQTIHEKVNECPKIASINGYVKLCGLIEVMGKLDPTRSVSLKDFVPNSTGPKSFGQFVTEKFKNVL